MIHLKSFVPRVLYSLLIGLLLNAAAYVNAVGIEIEWIQQGDIAVDGQLNERVYQTGDWHTGFHIQRSENLAKNQTSFRLFTDGNQLYFVARMYKSTGEFASGGASRDRVLIAQGDHINLLLRTHRDVSDFFQFQIAPNGHFSDIRLMQGGVTREYTWTTSAVTGSSINKETREWILEMAVPLSELNIDPTLDNWYVNVARSIIRQPQSDGNPREISSWISTPTEIENPTILAPVKLPDFNRNQFAWDLQVLDTKVLSDDNQYILRNVVSITNQTGVPQSVTAYVSLDEGNLNSPQTNLKIADQQQEILTLDIPLGTQSKQYVQRSIKLVNAENPAQQLINYHNFFQYEYFPARLDLIQPGYRNTIFHTQNVQSVQAILSKLDDNLTLQNLRAGILDSTGNWLNASITENQQGSEWLIEVQNIANLPEGKHKLTVYYTTTDQSTEQQLERTIRKVPYQPGEIWIDARGILHRDGKPFPAYGFHYGRRDFSGEYERFLPNMFYSVYLPVWASSFKRMRNSVEQLKQHEIYSVISVASASQNGSATNQPDELTAKEQEEYRKLALAARNNPHIVGYYLSDEPEWRGLSPARMQAIYDILNEYDPYHPVSITNNTDQGVINYLTANDLPNPDPYPIFLKDAGPSRHLSRIGIYVSNIPFGQESYRAAWVTPQAFDLNYFRRGESIYRGPTATELRAQQTIALIYGATGITWYTENLAWDEPGVQSAVPYLSWEYRWLFDHLVQDRPQIVHNQNGILVGMCQPATGTILLIVNQEGSQQTLQLSHPSIANTTQWNVIGSAKSVLHREDQLSISLTPYETIILASSEIPLATELFPEAIIPSWDQILEQEQQIRDSLYIAENMAHVDNGTVVRTVGRRNRWNVMTTNNGSKIPGSAGYNAENFKPGEGIEVEFPETMNPKTIKIYGSNILKGRVLVEQSGGSWQDVATFEHPEEVWEYNIEIHPAPTRKIRIIAEEVAYYPFNSIKIIEVEVYE